MAKLGYCANPECENAGQLVQIYALEQCQTCYNRDYRQRMYIKKGRTDKIKLSKEDKRHLAIVNANRQILPVALQGMTVEQMERNFKKVNGYSLR